VYVREKGRIRVREKEKERKKREKEREKKYFNNMFINKNDLIIQPN